MSFTSISFQDVETEAFNHFFQTFFQVIHDFIKSRSTYGRNAIINEFPKSPLVLKKQLLRIYVKRQRLQYRSLPCRTFEIVTKLYTAFISIKCRIISNPE